MSKIITPIIFTDQSESTPGIRHVNNLYAGKKIMSLQCNKLVQYFALLKPKVPRLFPAQHPHCSGLFGSRLRPTQSLFVKHHSLIATCLLLIFLC